MLSKNKFFKQRLFIIAISICFSFIGLIIILYIFNENIVLYKTPSIILSDNKYYNNPNPIRLGGIVKQSSVEHRDGYIIFVITDDNNEVKVIYKGILPSLFKEGQNVVVYGKLDSNNIFNAKELLAKHDEYYRPNITK